MDADSSLHPPVGDRRVTISYNFISLLVSIISMLISIAATMIAVSSLSQAKRVADRDHVEWKQRKWFDLYFEADKAYDALRDFQQQHQEGVPASGTEAWNAFAADANGVMDITRRVHSMAMVFPRNPAIDKLASVAVYSSPDTLLSSKRLTDLFDAVEGIRQKACITDLTVLN